MNSYEQARIERLIAGAAHNVRMAAEVADLASKVGLCHDLELIRDELHRLLTAEVDAGKRLRTRSS